MAYPRRILELVILYEPIQGGVAFLIRRLDFDLAYFAAPIVIFEYGPTLIFINL